MHGRATPYAFQLDPSQYDPVAPDQTTFETFEPVRPLSPEGEDAQGEVDDMHSTLHASSHVNLDDWDFPYTTPAP
jgi:hypothetical protein